MEKDRYFLCFFCGREPRGCDASVLLLDLLFEMLLDLTLILFLMLDISALSSVFGG